MAIVGPGSQIQELVEVGSILDGANEMEAITLHNPLTDDFQIMVAQDVPVNVPFEIRQSKHEATTKSERDVAANYGFGLKNPDHRGKKHIHNTAIIPAGGQMTFRGTEAQTALRQLVNEVLQREGHGRLIADPKLRKETEEKIIVSRRPIQELMDNNLSSVRTQTQQALDKVNEDEQAFPTIETPEPDQSGGTETPDAPASDKVGRRKVGRPKKADTV